MTKEEQIGKLKRLGDDVIYALIDNPYECPIVINKQGIICFMSRFSKRLIGIDPDEAVGKHIKDVIKETHLHEILKDGKARIADLLYIAGKQQVISRIPLKDLHGKILGAVGKGVLNEAVKVAELSKRIEVMDGQLQYYQKQVSDLKGGATIVGRSAAIAQMKESAMLAAKSNASVLMTGESGTGKEVAAYFIHQNSSQGQRALHPGQLRLHPPRALRERAFRLRGGGLHGGPFPGKAGKIRAGKQGDDPAR